MKHLLRPLFAFALSSSVLSTALPALAQAPFPYFVTAPCGNNNAVSTLRRLLPGNTLATIGIVTEGMTQLNVNGLAGDPTDPGFAYAMPSVTGGGLAALLNPVTLYRIDLTNAQATAQGTIPVPPGTNANDVGFIINQAADGAPGPMYVLTGAVARVNVTFIPGQGFVTNVSDVRLFVGTIGLPAVGPVVATTWRQVNTTDPATAVIINNIATQSNAFLAGTGSLPDGGFQDIAYDPGANVIVSYLGVEQRFVRVVNPFSAPQAFTTAPAVPIPGSGTATGQVGSIFRANGTGIADRGDLFAVVSETGRAHQIDWVTGTYLGTTLNMGVNCFRGDATTSPAVVTLPVELVSFGATPVAGAVQLTWRTASERNTARFEVERTDGAHADAWHVVTTERATNDPNGARYQTRDASPTTTTARYRLAMYDHDGSRAYSPTVEVRFDRPAVLQTPYPNPAAGAFAITLAAPAPAGSTLVLLDARGGVAWQQTLATGTMRAAVPALRPGVYQLIATLGAQRETQRVVVTAP